MGCRILVVEDNDMSRSLFHDVLAYYGYEVLEATDGLAGVRTARESQPDIILMDIQMPYMDGFTATSMLKGDPATKNIKIIVVTSFAMAGDKEKVIRSGADDYISKPIDIRELLSRIEKHAGGAGYIGRAGRIGMDAS